MPRHSCKGCSKRIQLVKANSLQPDQVGRLLSYPGPLGVATPCRVQLGGAEKREQFNLLVNLYQQELTRANNDVQIFAQFLRNKLVGEIQVVIREIGEEKGYSLVIDSTTITYFTRTNIVDITGEIVKLYDQRQLGK